MEKKKKVLIIVVSIILVVIIGLGLWFLIDSLNKSNNRINELESRIANNNNNTVENTNIVKNTIANNSDFSNKTTVNENANKEINNGTNVNKVERITETEMYETVINDYKKAVSEYNSADLYSEQKIKNKYQMVNAFLIAHVDRYKNDGIKLTYGFYDIDNNGISELIISASGGIGAIYSYNSDTYQPVKIFYLDAFERGQLSIYSNGVLMAAGSGGAAFHNYEFGKISSNGISYELIENINEEYKNDTPEYRDAKTNNILSYKSLDEIKTKYLSNSQELKINFNNEI